MTCVRSIVYICLFQACFRGYRVRKTFLERKILLMKHDKLRQLAAKYVVTPNV